MTLAEFLLARIAEDQEAAEAAAKIPDRVRMPDDAVTISQGVRKVPRPGVWGHGGGPFRVADSDPKAVELFGLVDTDGPRVVIADDGWDESEPVGAAYYVATIPTDHDAARHIALHNPARVLAECQAKRRIVTWAERRGEGVSDIRADIRRASRSEVLRHLALPYVDHPDYDAEWKP